MTPNSAKIVAELDATLRELTLAQQKTAADGHDNTALTGGNDGDAAPKEGARAAEMKADVNKQQELSQQKVDGTAKSPVAGTAASVGTAEEAKSDNKQTKDKADDPGTANSDLATKTASVLALGDEIMKIAGEMPPELKEKIEGKKDGEKAAAKAPGVEAAKDDAKALEVKKVAAAVDQLLPEGADLQKCAGVPDLPTEEGALQKVASDVVAGYIQKCAEAYPDDVQKGAQFAANFHAGLAELQKHASATTPELAEIQKIAAEDAQNVAALLGGMGGEGMPPEAMMGDEGDGDGDEGGEGEGDGDGDEGVPADEGGEGDPAAAGGENAESILAALQGAGVDPAAMAKIAAARGLDEARVLKTLSTLKPKSK